MIRPDSGRESAREAWRARKVHVMVSQELPRLAPRLHEDHPFYLSSVAGVSWGPRFCADYNAEIERLLERHGTPDWAPGQRRIAAGECLGLLANLQIHDFSGFEPEAAALCQRVLDEWSWAAREDAVLAYEPRREIVLIAREVTSIAQVWFDLVDLRELEYMQHYELPGSLAGIRGASG
ncbi:hypothetical protein G6O69_30275 [Pseudenhygromyxa sp. WMMC2535]|uniref:hypothetical protein n=1 Tax=Pseudenhygromyxa sp. WMMC2535 TaxID=2712867 RepID=UPI0015524A1D|nr:hypothetical protein [Pseudenhygromyxa sp. WMMC2535]NVB42148.1 hypothetical protein [Pseudenhygromyxa sp. WMMC2535]